MIRQPQRMGSRSSPLRNYLAQLQEFDPSSLLSNPQRAPTEQSGAQLAGEVTRPALAPVTPEAVLLDQAQDELINPPAMPPAAAPPAATPPGAAPGGALANFQQFYDFLNQDLPPIPEPTEEQIAQLVAQRGRPEASLPLALGAMLSRDKGLRSVGTGLYNAVEASRQPFDVGGGMGTIDPRTGQYTADPFRRAQDERERQEKLRTQALALAQAQATREANANYRRDTLAATQAYRTTQTDLRNKPKKTGLIQAATGTAVSELPDGTLINLDTNTPVPYGGTVRVQEFEKKRDKAREYLVEEARANELLAEVEANPALFSMTNAMLARLPAQALVKTAQRSLSDKTGGAHGLTREDLQLRADIATKAAAIINKLYGSVLTSGESGRAGHFLPEAGDTIETLLPKLHSALGELRTEMGQMPDWAYGAVERERALYADSQKEPDTPQRPSGEPSTATTLENYSEAERAAARRALEDQ